MGTETLAVEAVLVAEFGRGLTRAYLVDLIDGEHRFLARLILGWVLHLHQILDHH